MQQLSGKTAVVTGGGSGIGAALARAFAREGMNIVIADIVPADEFVASLQAGGTRTIFVQTDVSSRESVNALAERSFAEFGQVHLLCNNAGVNVYSPFRELKPDDWDWILGINLKGVIHGMDAFVPRMLEVPGPKHIMNTASVAGIVALSAAGTISAYTTTKHAVLGLSEYVRAELAPVGIEVSVLCPGTIKSRLRNTGRYAPSLEASRPPDEWVDDPRIDADEAAVGIVAAIKENRPFIFTDQEFRPYLERRFKAMMECFDLAPDIVPKGVERPQKGGQS